MEPFTLGRRVPFCIRVSREAIIGQGLLCTEAGTPINFLAWRLKRISQFIIEGIAIVVVYPLVISYTLVSAVNGYRWVREIR
jgi:hypothetical protein